MEKDKKSVFSKTEVDNLNDFQLKGEMHPFTCCSAGTKEKCERRNGKSEGILIASEDGWVCPCGDYTQDWAHGFMK